ncbi:sperm acrosome membrane-associated protein 6 isoform X9 [Meriones unguiculatus]|uniref:sperm acrosome membrane-associated protein 6 isoform X9 n=1 Tax=Meriones unguiculatus TaxID=10047 RepID=UPI00293F1070|nr:sperm acrosome membrane-associated protein 6 isoform X9 [Meriones unguiculatus]XP_060222772.1 sperm acrosome membrane-associated protein 6 isoform X9 [Meriones unguiculatus]XP_060222773.1 sperm acrosome membrane-associated protein 6 isoform X9 [Meriones unguiculatus]
MRPSLRNLGVPVDLTRLRDLVWRLQGSPTLLLFTGVQEFTRLFHCQGCYSTICDLPLDCPGEGLGLGYQGRGRPYAGLQESPDLSPVQDLIVKRGNQALFSCTVGFQLPESELTYSWKFAEGGLRTRDMSYFRDVPGAHGYLARIRPVQPKHSGTFVCVILHDQRPLARLYFYLNVTGPPPPGEMELQVTFREVVNWSAREAEVIVPWSPSLGELLALPRALTLGNLFLMAITAAFLSASVTVLAWCFKFLLPLLCCNNPGQWPGFVSQIKPFFLAAIARVFSHSNRKQN